MRTFALTVLLLAGCAKPEPVNNSAVDINAAADRAQGDIDTYAANSATADEVTSDDTPAPAPAPGAGAAEAPLAPAAPGETGGLPDDRTPVAEGPFADDSPQAAADIVQRYYAALENGNYRQAWALWGNGGRDSGMSAGAFAGSFSKYKEYHANIGAPGRVDAGAGQRYVTVPVQVYARFADGRPDYRIGSVTLHRVGDIDGATAEQKKWRIRSIDLKPVPAGKGAGGEGGGRGPDADRVDDRNGGRGAADPS